MELRSGLCAGQSSSSTPILENNFCMDLTLCTRELSCWNRKGPFPNCCHNWKHRIVQNATVCCALRFPFNVTKGPRPNYEKLPQSTIPPPPNFSWHYEVGQVAVSWHPPNPYLFFGLHHSIERFPLLQTPEAASFTPFQPTLGIVTLGLCTAAWQTHFMKLPMNSYCANVASRGSLELRSECCNLGQTICMR